MAKRGWNEAFQVAKEQRIAVWKDTERHISRFSPRPLWRVVTAVPCRAPCRISVVNADCIDHAVYLKERHGHVGIQNMASARYPGGGIYGGARAQEEEICRRSDLMNSLRRAESEYPIHDKVLVHEGITFFKKGEADGYSLYDNQIHLTVFTSPAVKHSYPVDHKAVMRDRIDRLTHAVECSGVDVMVFGAWGCGAFGLCPHMIAQLFKERLACTILKEAHFAILNDLNGHQNKFEIFQQVLLET